MKRFSLIMLFFVISNAGVFSGNLVAFFSYASFNSPDKGPYLETYISVIGSSIRYVKQSNGKYMGQVKVAMLFSENEKIVATKKYILSSPEIDDTLKGTVNFIDLQRIPLNNGIYTLELQLSDKNKTIKPYDFKQEVTVSFPADRVMISDIEIVDNFKKSTQQNILTKNGMDIVPYCSNYFPENAKKITFYAEIYNASKYLGDRSKFIVNSYLESYETQKMLEKYSRFSTMRAGNVNVVLSELNIDKLPSGNFYLVVEVKDKSNNVVINKKYFFQRMNPSAQYDVSELASIYTSGTFVEKIDNKDSLAMLIRSLRPISSSIEKTFAENQLNSSDLKMMQQFFYNFWVTRYGVNAEQAWNEYYKDVLFVNKEYGTKTLKGFETDRGRVYLQYGKPDNKAKSDNEPNTYPYEIWHYYRMKADNQTNKRFVFYNPDLSTNNYELIHSDARGEFYNSHWQMKLHKRTVQSMDTDQEKPGINNFGNNVLDNFENPK